ncbi:MAG: SUMF1/EgtB/PvdO family nonheme iron enzyme [Bacteroidota bacterium]
MSKVYRYLYALSLLLFGFLSSAQSSKGFYSIPAQQFNYQPSIDEGIDTTFIQRAKVHTISTDDFSLSRQISLADYKVFVAAQPVEEQQKHYPDSNITTANAYREYWETDDYNKYPALGISWDSALAYCRWRTLSEQKDGSYTYYYILPTLKQWLNAFRYLDGKRKKHDLNRDYADWLFNMPPPLNASFIHDLTPDLVNDMRYAADFRPNRLTIGASYRLQFAKIMDYARFERNKAFGYPDVGFRMVKVFFPSVVEQQSIMDRMIIDEWKLF